MRQQAAGSTQQAANGKTLPVASCPVCGKGIYAVYMWMPEGHRVHVGCYAPALVRAARTDPEVS